MLLLGLLLELFVVVWIVYRDSVGFKSLEDWVAFGGDMFSLLREDSVGVASLYGSGS